MERILELLEIEHFKSYLYSLSAEEFVGVGANICECPIARYLKINGIEGAIVGCKPQDNGTPYIAVDDEVILEPEKVPEWLKSFVVLIDIIYGKNTITARQAIRALLHSDDNRDDKSWE